MKISRGKGLLILGVALVVIDQIIKILVKTNMSIGEHFSVFGNWFQIFFIENEGMAFGMKFGGALGKLFLSLFRILLCGFLCWWITKLARRGMGFEVGSGEADVSVKFETSSNAGKSGVSPKFGKAKSRETFRHGIDGDLMVPTGVLVGLTMITAGAFGNIIDCLFYGQIFSASEPGVVASFGGSYAPFLFGKVVDMFYFPLIDTTWPSWLPFIGGQPFRFFEPIFNFADSCVTVGAFYLILFHYKFFTTEDKKN